MDTPPALRVPQVEAPSAQQYFLREMNMTIKRIPSVGWVAWSKLFSALRWYLVKDFGDYNTSELAS